MAMRRLDIAAQLIEAPLQHIEIGEHVGLPVPALRQPAHTGAEESEYNAHDGQGNQQLNEREASLPVGRSDH